MIMFAGIASNMVQIGGFRFSGHPLVPKFNKLNPMKGFGRIFSKNSVMELFKSLFKVAIISIASYFTIKSHWTEIPPLMGLGGRGDIILHGTSRSRDHFRGSGDNDFSIAS